MGVRILEDRESGESALYCSTSGVAFGNIFPSREAAEKFLEVYPDDPRLLSDAEFELRHSEFTREHICECGAVREEDEPAPDGFERFQCQWCARKKGQGAVNRG